MANEFIKVPVKSGDSEVLLNLDSNDLIIRLKKPLKIKASSVTAKNCDFEMLDSTILEVQIDAIFSLETILEIADWVSELKADSQ